jgi:hypothetical protein
MENTNIRFFYNGLKVGKGKLETCHYSYANNNTGVKDVTVYAKSYKSFSDEVAKEFAIKNNTDLMTDYFDTDVFTVSPTSKYYAPVLKTVLIGKVKNADKYKKELDGFAVAFERETSTISNLKATYERLLKEIKEIELIIEGGK